MEVKWSFPKLKYGYNPPAIYRMDFDTGYFYIGSSKKVKTRFLGWRTLFKNDSFQSKMFADAVKSVKEVTVTIIEQPSVDKLKDRETYHIGLYFDNPLLVNRSPSGFTNAGLKPLPAHLVKPKKVKERKPPKPKRPRKFKPPIPDHVYAYSKGVIQFDLNGNYIQSHKSMTDAAKSIGVKLRRIRTNVNVKKHNEGVNGFIFKVCGDNSPIELFTKKEKKSIQTPSRWRAVKNILTGEVFPNSAIVAKMENMKSVTYFWKQLNGEKPNPYPYRYV